jgi:hypothetical protein
MLDFQPKDPSKRAKDRESRHQIVLIDVFNKQSLIFSIRKSLRIILK